MLHAEDYDFYCRLGEFGYFKNLDEYLYKYRVHGESVSDKNLELQEKTASKIAYRELTKYGFNAKFTYNDILNLRKYVDINNEISIKSRIQQIRDIHKLTKECSVLFKLKKYEQKKLKHIWFNKCIRTLKRRKILYKFIWRFIYKIAAKL
jgi:hypothetical protein